jgi:cation diffusion facilitator family transporter
VNQPSAPPAAARSLTRYAWLSIAAAVATIGLKSAAFVITGSVGLLSDAAESLVNLVAAIVALVALSVAARPADASHHFGHGKAEYFSAWIEGVMIFVAAAVIVVSAVRRFLDPQPLESVGLGLAITMVATAINAAVGALLIRVGRRQRSITLEADGRHLMTDVWTSVGVIIGVALVGITGWDRLDPVVAFAVGVNILFTGGRLVARSSSGLMDHALPAKDHERILGVLDRFRSDEVHFHALQTRESGRHRFISVHVLVPGAWTVQQGHDLLEDLEDALCATLPDTEVHTHLEPLEDERAYRDADRGLPMAGRPEASGQDLGE